MSEITKEQALESFNAQAEEQNTQQLELDKKILTNIEKFGHTYMGIFSDASIARPAFIYTVGLHLSGLPEIIMSGNLDQAEMHGVISNLAGYWLQEKRPIFGDYPDFIKLSDEKSAPISVVKVDPDFANDNYLFIVKRLYPDAKYEVAQLYWPDINCKLPFDDDYSQDEAYVQDILPLV